MIDLRFESFFLSLFLKLEGTNRASFLKPQSNDFTLHSAHRRADKSQLNEMEMEPRQRGENVQFVYSLYVGKFEERIPKPALWTDWLSGRWAMILFSMTI